MNHDNRAARFAAREETLRPVATRAGRRRGARGGITTAWESLAREEIEQAALDLIRRRGHEILATARRYAQTLDDADDAYQRGLEILLRKAPTTSEVDLVRWLKVVVKHEAFNLRRQRERHSPITDDGHLAERPTAPEITHDQVALYERLGRGAEALALLKPQEVRALRLRAEGYSYREICQITGWSYTKVNRCITEGGRALRKGAAAIEDGQDCERLAPLLGRHADGVIGLDELPALQRHLPTCLACRARLNALGSAQRRASKCAIEPDTCRRRSRR